MTRLHVAYTAIAVGIAVTFAAVVLAVVRPIGIFATIPGPSLSGQCTLTPTSSGLLAPSSGNRLGCALSVAVPVVWPVLWTQASGQLGVQPGNFTVGASTGVSFGSPGLTGSGGGR